MKRDGRVEGGNRERGKKCGLAAASGGRVALCHDFVQQVPRDVEDGRSLPFFLSERVGSAWLASSVVDCFDFVRG